VLVLSNWYNLSFGINSNVVWSQVNNEDRNSTAYTTLFASTDPLGFGFNAIVPVGNETGTFFDAAGFWGRDLSTNDVRQLYNSGSGLFFSSFRGSPVSSGTPFITSDPTGGDDNAFSGDLGEAIDTVNGMRVHAIGVYIKAGSIHTHTLRIVDADDCSTVTGTSVTLDFTGHSGWTYVTLPTPVDLVASHNYKFYCSYVTGEDHYYLNVTYSHTADASITDASYYDGTCHNSGAGADEAFGPVNIKYDPL
jgi:hypothetical protein